MKLIIILSVILSFQVKAKLLDKTLAIINDQVITLSQVKRIKASVAARRNIIPAIYNKAKFSNKEIIKIKIERQIIREKLNEIGYIVNDDEVAKTIKNREKMLGINRKALIQFLNSNKLTFDEYFELTREALEFSRFNSWVIQPLVSITEQEIKNTFYKENSNNKTLSFRYKLIDFSIERKKIKQKNLKKFPGMLEKFQTTGVIPNKYSSMDTNDLGNITEDGLTPQLKRLLKNTEEGAFSKTILLGNRYHVFFIKRKDLVESSIFIKEKNRIRNKIFTKNIKHISNLWFDTEKNKHYIKYFF